MLDKLRGKRTYIITALGKVVAIAQIIIMGLSGDVAGAMTGVYALFGFGAMTTMRLGISNL